MGDDLDLSRPPTPPRDQYPFASERSASIGAIAAALAKAQGAMSHASKDREGNVIKDGKKLYSYGYATLASVLDAVREPLAMHGLSIVQLPEDAGEKGVALVTWLIHASGEWFRGRVYLPARQNDAQGFGGAISYGRRYSLMAMVGIASDDDDAQESSQQTRQAPPPQPRRQESPPAPRPYQATNALLDPPDSVLLGANVETLVADYARIGREGNMQAHAAIGAKARALNTVRGSLERGRLLTASREAAEAIRHRASAVDGAREAFGEGGDT